jgi:DNA-binding NtrC family response regulator
MEHVPHKLIFIIEDNDMYSLMLDYMLSKESSCRFVSFKTGEECIANLNMNPSLVILDYGLPGINGLETFKEIKKYNPKIPVVILTENHDVHLAQQFIHERGGVYEYLLKEKDSVRQVSKIIDKLLIDKTEDRGHIKHEERKRNKMLVNLLLSIVCITTLIFCFFWFLQRC